MALISICGIGTRVYPHYARRATRLIMIHAHVASDSSQHSSGDALANLPADSAPLVAAFAARLFARESADNRERVPAKRRLALVQAAFEFFSVRTEPAIARVESVAGDDNDMLTIVETVTTDSPFIVDSLLEYFHHLGATVRTILHPIIKVTRDKDGRIATFERSLSTERGESFVHAELELVPTPEQASQIEREVVSILTEVHQATGDFDEMTSRALQI